VTGEKLYNKPPCEGLRSGMAAIRGVKRGQTAGIPGGVIGVILLRQGGRSLHQFRIREIRRRGRVGNITGLRGNRPRRSDLFISGLL
jgi:hypothetical protein